ncbi:MAG: DNA repair protein RadC [Spirosomataceae bacterium]
MEPYQPTNLTIKSWAEEDRPREKLMLKGKAALSDAELLGILIGSGIQNLTAVDLAKDILRNISNDLNQLAKLSVKDLSKFKGIGEARAITIVAALELGRRRKETEAQERPKVTSSNDAFQVLRPHLMDLPHEEFWVILLNRGNQVIRTVQISTGGVSGTVADPKLIFKYALEYLASAIILAHNHPSGNLTPSQADKDLTRKIKEGGRVLEVPVLDHLILSDKRYLSFADEGIF